MNNQLLFPFISAIVVAVVILVGLRYYTASDKGDALSHIAPNKVKGLVIRANSKLYPLDEEQQKTILRILNQSLPVGKNVERESEDVLGFTLIIIHQKEGKDIEIIPIAWRNNALIFSAPVWNEDSYLQEYSNGRLQAMIRKIID